MNRKKDIKQLEEEQLLRYFSMCYDDFPKAKIEKTESPDFVLHLNRHISYGLELTKLFVQLSQDGLHFMPNFEMEKTKLIERIRTRFEMDLPYRLSAHFDFSNEYYNADFDFDLLSREIFDSIKRKISKWAPTEAFITRIKSHNLPDWLDSIDILHHPENQVSNWVSCKVDVPAENFLASIQQSIAFKESKLSLYRKKRLDRYWLLIVAECLNCASPFNIHNLIERWSFESGFHQVFLLELYDQKVHHLRLRKPE